MDLSVAFERLSTVRSCAVVRYGGNMFHLKDGWNFGRQDDGSVVIEHRNYQIDAETGKYTTLYTVNTRLVVDADGWASIIASVSAGGEVDGRFFAALEFHNSKGQIGVYNMAEEKK